MFNDDIWKFKIQDLTPKEFLRKFILPYVILNLHKVELFVKYKYD